MSGTNGGVKRVISPPPSGLQQIMFSLIQDNYWRPNSSGSQNPHALNNIPPTIHIQYRLFQDLEINQ